METVKRDIRNKIYKQMLQHFYCENAFLQEEAVGTRDFNLQQSYSYIERVALFSAYTEKIQSALFEGIKEVKGEDKLSDPDVIAKKKRGIQYCEVATRWGKANGYKEWRYLFIPSKQVMPNSSFIQLTDRFQEL